ncbi:MAG TPA: hypothetical protein VNP72_03500, partial [Longimicrobium sp.]|nr:hypothetical protein [Longimicrobium sp.]
MDTRTTPVVKAVLLSLLVSAGLAACEDRDADTKDGATPAAAAVDGVIIPQPLAYAGFPVDSATILGWIQATDTVSIRQHAWNIWAGLTAMTNQISNGDTLPVYETWLSRFEVYGAYSPAERAAFATRGRPLDRGFHSPVQFHHAGALGQAGASQVERIVAGVKYNMASAEHVWAHAYTDSATLDSLNNAWPTSTPIADRNIIPFPDSAVATKPVYWNVNQTGLTIMPYWAGVDSSTADSMPTPTTWTQFVAIDPSGQQVGQTVQVTEGGTTYQARVIGLDQFYSFTLTQDEVDDIYSSDPALDLEVQDTLIDVLNDTVQTQERVTVGDFAVLVAMHVSTKEIGNWTWQTFWWTPDPASNPLSQDQTAAVQGPFKNFAMNQ